MLKIKNFVKSSKFICSIFIVFQCLNIFADLNLKYELTFYENNDSTVSNFDFITSKNKVLLETDNTLFFIFDNNDTLYVYNEKTGNLNYISLSFFEYFTFKDVKKNSESKSFIFLKDTVISNQEISVYRFDYDSNKFFIVYITKKSYEEMRTLKNYDKILKNFLDIEMDLIFNNLLNGIPVNVIFYDDTLKSIKLKLKEYEIGNFSSKFDVLKNNE